MTEQKKTIKNNSTILLIFFEKITTKMVNKISITLKAASSFKKKRFLIRTKIDTYWIKNILKKRNENKLYIFMII